MGRRLLLLAFGLGGALLLSSCEPPPSLRLAVTTTADGSDAAPGDGVCEMTDTEGDCSLRAAIDEANAAAVGTVVTVSLPTGLYHLSGGGDDNDNATNDLDIDSAATIVIDGDDAGAAIDAGAAHRAIDVRSGGVTLTDLALTGGKVQGMRVGAGATAVASRTSYHHNDFDGLRVMSGGILLLVDSTASSNPRDGIRNDGVTALRSVTVTANDIGVHDTTGSTSAIGSIIAANGAADCVGSAIMSGDHNLDSDATCGLSGPNDVAAADPMLGPLDSTRVPGHLPQAGSRAIDAIASAACDGLQTTDQHHEPRPQIAGCDMGALERPGGLLLVDSAGNEGDALPGDGFCDVGTGACTLRAAIDEGNAAADVTPIEIQPGLAAITAAGSVDDTNVAGDLDVTQPVVITGNGATVHGTAAGRVLDLHSTDVALAGLTIRDGHADDNGGGLRAVGTDLSLLGVTVTANTAAEGDGGGLHHTGGSLTLVGSSISQNTAQDTLTVHPDPDITNFHSDTARGGGLRVDGVDVTITDSTIEGNTSVGSGGGLHQTGGKLDMMRTAVVANQATGTAAFWDDCDADPSSTTVGLGGGMWVEMAPITLNGLDLSSNVASQDGGGLYQFGGTLEIDSSAVEGNEANGHAIHSRNFCTDTGSSEHYYGAGGGIFAQVSPATITNATVTGNTATGDGGGMALAGIATIHDSVVNDNSASGWVFGQGVEGSVRAASGGGGGISAGNLTVVRTTVNGNDTTATGGGISAGFLVIQDSTVSQNTVGYVGEECWDPDPCVPVTSGRGGGIEAFTHLSATDVTITGNEAAVEGGATFTSATEATTTLRFSTLVGNLGGGAFGRNSGTLNLVASIVAANDGGADCQGFFITNSSFSLSADPACGVTDPAHQTDDPLLGPLTNNGGPTFTLLPELGSPALDAVPAGTPGACDGTVPRDQRGVTRPQGTGCDIGAVER